jgi:CO/xanthine dehydrogenase Mo-binding subunit
VAVSQRDFLQSAATAAGVAAALANAIHHATGVRVRSLPLTLDKILV